MKNFVFPQIFQPIVGQNNILQLEQWHKTSRRIRTQVQINRDEVVPIGFNKTARVNLLLKSTTTNFTRREEQKQPDQQQDTQNVANVNLKEKRKVKFNMKIGQNQKIDKAKPNIRISQAIKLKKTHKTNVKFQKSLNERQDFQQKQDNDNNKDQRGSLKLQQSEHIQNFKKNRTKQRKNTHKVTFERERNNNNNLQSNKTLKSQKSIGVRSDKSIIQSKKSIGSSKRLNGSHSSKKTFGSDRRRAGIQNFIMLDSSKNCQENKEFFKTTHLKHGYGDGNRNRSQQAQFQLQSQCTVFDSKQQIQQQIQVAAKKTRRMTYHGIEISQKQIRQQKKSCTIWNIEQQFESSMDEIIQKQQPKKVQKKLKKKVHFGRTSIQQKTIEDNVKQVIRSFKQYGFEYPTNKSSKLKGIISRTNQLDSALELEEPPNLDQKGKKIFGNAKNQVKKGVKLRKLDTENVYNQLNYLRMRLNVSKKKDDDWQVSKPHPQAILLTVEKVMNQLQQERIQRTRMHNMMIDFGVKMTKDTMIRQIGIRDRIKNYVI